MSEMILAFSSVSNDEIEMENNSAQAPGINLTIDMNAVNNANPNTRSVTPPLETPTYSYCMAPKFTSMDHSFIQPPQSNYGPPSFSERPPSGTVLFFSRPNSQNSYHPFMEELDWGDYCNKRKLSPRPVNAKRFMTAESREFSDNSGFNAGFNQSNNNNNNNQHQNQQQQQPTHHHQPYFPSQQDQPTQFPSIVLKSNHADHCLFQNDGLIGLSLFVIYDDVGSGIAADVYQIESRLNIGYSYALKKFKRPVKTAKQEQSLLKELHYLNELNNLGCPHIPLFHVAWKEDFILYAIMEYAEFGTLKHLMDYHLGKSFVISIPFLWHVINNVCTALAFIHHQEIVHLDIKNANLLIYEGGIIKIGDFGLATKEGPSIEEPEGDTR
jgi:hypothetical protein